MLYGALFVLVGVLLIGIEIKLIPGLGLVGILGVATALYGAWLTFQSGDAALGALVTTVAAVAAIAIIILLFRSSLVQGLVLRDTAEGQPSVLAETERERSIVGERGVTLTDLRPAGMARIDGKRVDVVADNAAFINAHRAVQVVRVAQNSIIVAPDEGGQTIEPK